MIINNLLEIYIPLNDIIDINEEKKRIQNKIDDFNARMKVLNLKVNNNNFISKAPKEIINKELKKIKDIEENLQKLIQNINFLK